MSSSASPSPNSPVSAGVPPPPSSPPPTSSPPPQPGPTPPPTTPPPQVNTPPPSQFPPPVLPPPPSQSPPPAASPPPQSPPLVVSPPPPAPSPPPPQSPLVVVSPPPPTTTTPSPPPPSNAPPPPSPPPTSPPPPTDPPPRSPPSDPPPNPTPPPSSPPPPPRRSPPPPPPATPPQTPPSSSSPPPPPTNSTTTPSPPFRSPPSSESPPSIRSLSPPPPIQIPPSNTNTTTTTATASPPSTSGGLATGGTVAIALIAGIVLLSIFGFAACCVWRRKKKEDSSQNGPIITSNSIRPSPRIIDPTGFVTVQISPSKNRNGSMNSGGLGNSRSWFSYEELIGATDGFSDEKLLGEGGFGSVYKGNLSDGREVAVKRLKIGGRQGEREFRSEVEIISRIHHRHLVSLVGYCINEDRRLLVYEFVPNNTLYYHLHGEGRPVVNWATRVKIAIGAARGIAYLHEDCHPRIIHRDIKSSNILLDDKFEARVSDFGLAKLAMDANSHITTRVMGTFGYMAPEYATSGKLTEKSDIYSFGVVLLELITGRKPVDTSQPLGEESVVEWARPLLSHAIEMEELAELADPRLEGNYIDSEMFRTIEAAASCVRHSAAKRPKMGQIVRAFDSILLDLNNGMKVGQSEVFNSAQQSEEIRLFQRMAFGSHNYSTDFFSQYSTSSEGNGVMNSL